MANTVTNYLPKLLAMGQMALREKAIMTRLVNRDLESQAAQRGAVVSVPLPSSISARAVTPAVTHAANVDFNPQVANVTLDFWYESPFQLSDKDFLEVAEGTIPMQASEAIKSLVNEIDKYIIGKHVGFFGLVGTAGTTPFGGSLNMASTARTLLHKQLAPDDDRRMVVDPDAEGNFLLNSNILQAEQAGSSDAIVKGSIGTKLGFDWYMDQNITSQSYTPGTAWTNSASWTFDGSNAIGVTTAAVVYTASGSVKIGDVFQLTAGGLGYVITAAATAVTAVTMNISFYPGLRTAVATAATLVVAGTTAYVPNLAFHRDAFAWASRPLQSVGQGTGQTFQAPVDPISGIALRLEVSRQYKQTTYSFDVLGGANVVRREYGVKVRG